jgi:ABC-type multidrug transport system fused ATPase/permease subunit
MVYRDVGSDERRPRAQIMSLYRRLLKYVRPYWLAFVLAVLGIAVVASGDVLMAYMVMPIIQHLQHPDPQTTWHNHFTFAVSWAPAQ